MDASLGIVAVRWSFTHRWSRTRRLAGNIEPRAGRHIDPPPVAMSIVRRA